MAHNEPINTATGTNEMTAQEADYLEFLFSGPETGPSVYETAERELAEMAAEKAARVVAEIASRCPRCAGSGRLAQFAHRNGGECFLCGGSGVFAGYSA